MTPEQMGHIRLKTRFSRLLEMAAKSSPVPCEAIADGMAVAIGERTFLVPDAMLRCGNPLPDTATRATDPVVIVEVLSPSNTAEEMAFKFEQYFSLPTLVHHLEVNPVSRSILHYRKSKDGVLVQFAPFDRPLRLDPPGITLELGEA